jgi:nicotinic acid mononucleotide adenylyltransferase
MSKINEIHESDLFGIVVESGCSSTLSSALMEVAGSSNTIYKCEIPYNKEYQESKYGKFKRSVSKEWIEAVLNKEYNDYIEAGFKHSKEINFIFASSWQLIDPVDPLVYAHGWFGLFDIKRNQKHFLHFTFRRDLFNRDRAVYGYYDRKNLLSYIANHAVDVLHTAISGNIEEMTPLVDTCILDMAYLNDNINYELLINALEKAKGDYFLVFDKNKVIRIEDLMRKSNEFVIQKGSFNPLHHGHIRQVTGTHEKYPNALPAFLISTFRYDKPHINYDELKDRIDMFAKAGYPLIICKSVLFYETFSLLKKWSYAKQFYFTVGYDTLNRIYKTDFDWVTENIQNVYSHAENLRTFINNKINQYKPFVKFLLFERKDFPRLEETHLYDELVEYIHVPDEDVITSTKIRNGEIENKLKL